MNRGFGTAARWAGRLVAAIALSALAAAPLAGCDGEGGGVKTANVAVGEMPAGAQWTGVYYSELYGYLHMVQDGDAIQGRWQRTAKDKWGDLHGKITGDVIRFSWTENTVGAVGAAAQRSGKGYFKYKRPKGDNVDDTIAGEIGKGESEAGDPWEAVKQRNVTPDLKSIGGTSATDIGGGDWDKENKERGNPEPPKPPN